MRKIFFGTDGWRALLDSEINSTSVAVVARAFTDYVLAEAGPGATVAVAYDTRRCSREFAEIFSRVMMAGGIGVLLSQDVTPTPVLSYTVLDRKCFAGVMITASHNPAEYNGIKFKASYGGPFSQDQTRKVEELLYANEPSFYQGTLPLYDMLPAYKVHIEPLIKWDIIKKASLPMLVDSMGGAGGTLIQEILAEHDCLSVKTIFGQPSHSFYGRLAEPIARNLVPACEEVRNGNYALCIATDGDADRLGIVRDDGEFLSAQTTILLIVDYLKRVRGLKGGIVHTSSVTAKLKEHFLSENTPVHDVQVGFKYITDVMVGEDICFGGEESGGFGYGMHIPERDGVFSGLLFLEMLSSSAFTRLSDYVSSKERELGKIYYDRIDATCDRADRTDILPCLFESRLDNIAGIPICGVQHFYSSRGIVNGLKYILQGECRWLLIRSSETEPLLRFYSEGQTMEEVKTFLDEGVRLTSEIKTT
jgi:phosphomannomutase